MTITQNSPTTSSKFPKAKLTRSRWRNAIIWIVPVVAALIAGYLVYDRVQTLGPEITISFKDGTGIRVGRTAVRYRGVQIGEVTAVELSKDMQHVLVTARLQQSAAAMAKTGSVFWIARLGDEIGNISNIGTVITGAYIEALPGEGKSQTEFVGLENAVALERGGLKIVLRTDRVGLLRPNLPVYYRGVEVGVIQGSQLNANATAAEIQVLIKPRFVPLVRVGSKFWHTGGVDIKFGLFKGLQVNVESLRSLLSGGIAFATPDAKAARAKDGAVFQLYDEPGKDWLTWSPAIPLAPENPN